MARDFPSFLKKLIKHIKYVFCSLGNYENYKQTEGSNIPPMIPLLGVICWHFSVGSSVFFVCVWDHMFIELLFSEDGKYLFLKHCWFHNISCSHFHIILLHPILIIGLLQKICSNSLCLFRIDNIRTWWEEKNTYERLDGEEALVPSLKGTTDSSFSRIFPELSCVWTNHVCMFWPKW